MVRKLQKICLKCICSDLYLNFEICEKYALKIPECIGDEIFKYATGTKTGITKDETKMFKKKIMDLSKFFEETWFTWEDYLNKKRHFNVDSYDFLLNHRLIELSLKVLNSFHIYSSSEKIFTKKLFIDQVDNFMNSNHNEMLNFFKNTLRVEKSIIFMNQSFPSKFDPISPLIENSLQTLTVLQFEKCSFYEESFCNLFPVIFSLKNLEEFKFIKNSFFWFEIDKFTINLTEEHKEFGKKLKVLEISPLICKLNSFMFKNLENLENFMLFGNEYSSNSSQQIFQILSEQKLEFLKEIEIDLNKEDERTQIEFIQFITNIKNLTKISIQSTFTTKETELKFLNWLQNSCENLNEFYFAFFFKDELEEEFLKFLCNCKSIKTLKFDFCQPESYSGNSLNLLIKAMKNWECTLEKLTLSPFIFNEEWFYLLIPKFKNLKEFHVTDQTLYKFNNFLKNFIENHQQTLSVLFFSNFPLNYQDFCEPISDCCNLKTLNLFGFKDKSFIEKIFTNSFLSNNCLEKLVLVYRTYYNEDLDYFLNILLKLKQLKEVEISYFKVHRFYFTKFLDGLGRSNSNIESYIFQGAYMIDRNSSSERRFGIKTLLL